jgi:serine/threonine-protein kinase
MKTVLTPAEWTVLQDIVNTAADLDAAQRSAYLDEVCAGQPQLRSRADSLLAALASDESSFIGAVIQQAASATVDGDLPAAGTRIGPYRIQSVIGRGGMGVVYEAFRDDDQYRMRVAIKVAVIGLLSRNLIQRFRNERQILANLDHPNIARLLDGGTTDGGLPYVVMELVEGQPIDAYCQQRQLTVRQKLALFVQVAKAVHYAHQKLVVHRDLKPENILVTGHGEPKLLDFGIAKLLGLDHEGAPQAITAEIGRIMTPEYASPEQIRDEPVTTATDVYQLGVVLYQLLTSRLPFKASPSSLVRLEQEICEREPARPGIDNDLDLVILKAMEKEPARRYASAGEFAADIERYLSGFPVEARPASWVYVTRRWVRRHRLASIAAVFFLLLLTGSIIGMAILTRRAQTEAKTANQVTDFLVSLFDSNDPRNGRGDQITARELLDRSAPRIDASLKDSPEVRARLLDTMGGIYTRLGSFKEADRLLNESIELRRKVLRREDRDLASALSNLADNTANLGQLAEAEKLYREVLRINRKILSPDDDDLAASIANLSSVLFEEDKLQEAETLNVQAVEMRKRILGVDAPDTLITMNNLETVYMQEGQYVKAEALARDVLNRRLRTENQWHPDLGYSWSNLAGVLMALGRFDEAESAARKGLEIRLKAYPAEHPQIQWGRIKLAEVLNAAGKTTEAGQMAQQALDQLLKSVGPDTTNTAFAKQALATSLLEQGDAAGARKLFTEVLAVREKSLQPGSVHIALSWLRLAEADMALKNFPLAATEAERAAGMYQATLGPANVFLAGVRTVQAEIEAAEEHWPQSQSLAQKALDLCRATLPPDHPDTARAQSALGWALWKQDNPAQAGPLLEAACATDRKAFHDPAGTRPSAQVAARCAAFLHATR